MCDKSIYNKLKSDFSFVKDYGFYFSHDLKHYVHPAIVFIKNTVSITIGFDYEEHKFYILLSDSTERRYPSKEALGKIKVIDPKRIDFFNDGIPKFHNIVEDKVLTGDSYENQIIKVKKILKDYLAMHKVLIE